MRVIAGSAKSMPLKTIQGMDTRPTTDRIKETLFNMIQPYLCGCRFLDRGIEQRCGFLCLY